MRKTRHINDRISLRDWNNLDDRVHGQSLYSATPGLDLATGPTGGAARFQDPNRTRWVVALRIAEEFVVCKEAWALPHGDGAAISTLDSDYLSFPMAPNYRADHYEKFILAPEHIEPDGAICPRCLMCRVEAGYIVPDYRMKLVDPPDPADCASCT
jgi:hypothetical protein